MSEIRVTLIVKSDTKAIANRRFAAIRALLEEVPGVELVATDAEAGTKSSTTDAVPAGQPIRRITIQLRQVIEALLEIERTNGPSEMYGREVIARSGLKSGTVTPILCRLVDAGWVTVTVVEQSAAPSRRLHHFTKEGRELAVRLLGSSE